MYTRLWFQLSNLDHPMHGYNVTSIITVEPRLSEPLWPAPKSKRLDEQKVQVIESVFDVQLTTPTTISYSVYHRRTE